MKTEPPFKPFVSLRRKLSHEFSCRWTAFTFLTWGLIWFCTGYFSRPEYELDFPNLNDMHVVTGRLDIENVGKWPRLVVLRADGLKERLVCDANANMCGFAAENRGATAKIWAFRRKSGNRQIARVEVNGAVIVNDEDQKLKYYKARDSNRWFFETPGLILVLVGVFTSIFCIKQKQQ